MLEHQSRIKQLKLDNALKISENQYQKQKPIEMTFDAAQSPIENNDEDIFTRLTNDNQQQECGGIDPQWKGHFDSRRSSIVAK